jgi:hypothetical protein
MDDNTIKVTSDLKFKINYFNKISVNTNNIEKIIKKLAYFKPIIFTTESSFTILNIYIKNFIEELKDLLITTINDLNFLFNNLLEINNQLLEESTKQNEVSSLELEKNINLIIEVEKKIKYIDNNFIKLIGIHTGQIKLNDFEPFSLNYIFINLELSLADDFYEKNINFKYNIDQNINDWFLGDIYNITYILKKITKNAIKYSKLNNDIFINISSINIGINKKKIIIKIHDNNSHIPTKNNLFISPSGLYICKTILELHDGTIQHDYLNIIRGNIFTINIDLEIFNINNINTNKQTISNTLSRSLKSINFSETGLHHHNIIIIHNNENEKLYLYKIFKLNKNLNNIYSFKNGLETLCNLHNKLESINLIIIDIDLFNPEISNINAVAFAKLLRAMNYNKLIIGLCDQDNIVFIPDNNFDYIFNNPFTREKINLLFDFIDDYGIFTQLNKKIKLVDNKLKWMYS